MSPHAAKDCCRFQSRDYSSHGGARIDSEPIDASGPASSTHVLSHSTTGRHRCSMPTGHANRDDAARSIAADEVEIRPRLVGDRPEGYVEDGGEGGGPFL